MKGFLSDLKNVLGLAALRRVVRQLLANDGMALAGQLAYFFVLFLFPFLIFLVSIAGTVVEDPETTFKALVASTEGFLPREAIRILNNHLDRTLQSTASSTFIVSGLLTLVVGSASAESIIVGANRSYSVPETRPLWKRWGIAVFLIFGFTLLVATMVFLVLSPQSGAYLQRTLDLPDTLMRYWGYTSWTLAFLNLTLAFDILYYLAPDADLPFRWITPGGFMTTVLILVSNKIFIFWADNIFRPDQLYGQLGAGIVLLIWLFIVGLVVLAGIQINAELARMVEEQENAEIIEPQSDGPRK